ncbi:MAG: hypothetical protein PHW62_00560 [Candidatus Ratteibacteria bacterium]|nr:hypothetical protein [Candidatus Ratteibacteria bacterium]
MMETENQTAQRISYENALNTIRVQEGNEFGFKVDIVFETEQEAQSIFNRIPKSYRMRLGTLLYPHLNIRRPLLSVSISFIPDGTTGQVNESGRARVPKIKKILSQLLPHRRVTTTIMVPAPGSKNSFTRGKQFAGWV